MASKFKLSKLYVAPESSFGTEPDADGSDYKFLKAVEITPFIPSAEVIERPGMTGDLVRQAHVVGPKGGTFSFKLELKGSGTAAGAATLAIASEASPILLSCLGGVTRGTGATVGSGSTTTVIVVDTTAGLAVGMAVCINSEIRFVTVVTDGTHFTVNRALTGAPVSTDIVYASSMFKRANTGHQSLAFVVFRDAIEYTALGCHVKCKLAGINARGTGILEVQVTAASWAVTTKASLPAASLTGITAVSAPVVKGSPFAVAGTEDVISGLEMDLGSEFVFQESTAAADSKAGIELIDHKPGGAFKPYFAAGHLTAFYAGTEVALDFGCGTQANGYGIYVAKAQYVAAPTVEDRAGLVGQTIPFMVNDNGANPEWTISIF